jgi:hypothetical protein
LPTFGRPTNATVPQRGGSSFDDDARFSFAFFGAGASPTSRKTAPGGGPFFVFDDDAFHVFDAFDVFDDDAFDDAVAFGFDDDDFAVFWSAAGAAFSARRAAVSAFDGVGCRFLCLCAGTGSSVFLGMEPFNDDDDDDEPGADERSALAHDPARADDEKRIRRRCSRGGP